MLSYATHRTPLGADILTFTRAGVELARLEMDVAGISCSCTRTPVVGKCRHVRVVELIEAVAFRPTTGRWDTIWPWA